MKALFDDTMKINAAHLRVTEIMALSGVAIDSIGGDDEFRIGCFVSYLASGHPVLIRRIPRTGGVRFEFSAIKK